MRALSATLVVLSLTACGKGSKSGPPAAPPAAAHPTPAAPSPDWFTGATNVNLDENGAWVARKTLTLPAYDSGGDDGKTYKAPDRDTNPKKPTTRAADRHFVIHGRVKPVAILIFVRK